MRQTEHLGVTGEAKGIHCLANELPNLRFHQKAEQDWATLVCYRQEVVAGLTLGACHS